LGDYPGSDGPAWRADEEPHARRDRTRGQRHGTPGRHASAGDPDRRRAGNREVLEGPQAQESTGRDPGRPGARILAVEGRVARSHAIAARARLRRRAPVRQLQGLTDGGGRVRAVTFGRGLIGMRAIALAVAAGLVLACSNTPPPGASG